MSATDKGAAASPEAWRAFIGFLHLRREDGGQVGALARYALRRWDRARSDWRRDRSDFTARDLFTSVRRDWRDLGDRALTQAINEFLNFLWARATGADGWRRKH